MTQNNKRQLFFEQARAQLEEFEQDEETRAVYIVSVRAGDEPDSSSVSFFHNMGEAEEALVYLNNITVSMLMHEKEEEAKRTMN